MAPLLGCPSLHSAAMSGSLVQTLAATLLATTAPADELVAEVQVSASKTPFSPTSRGIPFKSGLISGG